MRLFELGVQFARDNPAELGLFRGGDDPGWHDTRVERDIANASLFTESFAFLDDWFTDRFGHGYRRSAHFSGDARWVAHFGPVCRCYPADGYRFFWSPEVRDLGDVMFDFQIAVTRELVGDLQGQELLDRTSIISDREPPGFHRRAAELFIDRFGSSYRSDDLDGALRSGHEIILSGSYLATSFSGTVDRR